MIKKRKAAIQCPLTYLGQESDPIKLAKAITKMLTGHVMSSYNGIKHLNVERLERSKIVTGIY